VKNFRSSGFSQCKNFLPKSKIKKEKKKIRYPKINSNEYSLAFGINRNKNRKDNNGILNSRNIVEIAKIMKINGPKR
jgi:hypothetical protein